MPLLCRAIGQVISTVGNAVEGFVRAVAPEIAPRRINAVSPGIIDTPMFPVEGDVRATLLGKKRSPPPNSPGNGE